METAPAAFTAILLASSRSNDFAADSSPRLVLEMQCRFYSKRALSLIEPANIVAVVVWRERGRWYWTAATRRQAAGNVKLAGSAVDRARVVIAVAIGLAVTVGMWLLMLAVSGFFWPWFQPSLS
jgi:hypothetical protein